MGTPALSTRTTTQSPGLSFSSGEFSSLPRPALSRPRVPCTRSRGKTTLRSFVAIDVANEQLQACRKYRRDSQIEPGGTIVTPLQGLSAGNRCGSRSAAAGKRKPSTRLPSTFRLSCSREVFLDPRFYHFDPQPAERLGALDSKGSRGLRRGTGRSFPSNQFQRAACARDKAIPVTMSPPRQDHRSPTLPAEPFRFEEWSIRWLGSIALRSIARRLQQVSYSEVRSGLSWQQCVFETQRSSVIAYRDLAALKASSATNRSA
ncbi:hypothetical protein HD553DRAFT_32975 [Filobasidium floriforme]|uniref:uncharacterized protein n=1 Tax=Filobasidium floriforme TaxID=5210 RepID=UPI001E8CB56B|nr:uncharacterized protein HD553DRAFT_32975 [Filobasidium floriforme]KAH8084705.1 hypothetical protein HD553DRAFT_32975 [Filobasidium floriforme]